MSNYTKLAYLNGIALVQKWLTEAQIAGDNEMITVYERMIANQIQSFVDKLNQ